tara:strand:- start:9207 stop:9359 length:153 start_codon:yes stop_codon:yes gene_type:complete
MIKKIKKRITDLISKYGWKAALGIFIFYLVRDVTLYILLPWFFANSLLCN